MSSRSRRRKSTQRNAGIALGAIGALLIACIAGAGVYLNATSRPTDRNTGCLLSSYESVTTVVVDLTDPISPVQGAALRNAMMTIRDEVPQYGRLEIYPLTTTETSTIEPLFAGCSPGSGEDVDSEIYGNPELADRQWRRQFADKVSAVVETSFASLTQAETSPLLEAIQSVAVTSFGTTQALNASDKRLIVISDMLHHTDELSMYGGAPHFNEFQASQYYRRVKPVLRGANVDVYLIVRETRRDSQQPRLYSFWVEFAADAGGYLRNWEPLQ